MCFHVPVENPALCKCPVTELTSVWFLPRMFPVVPRQSARLAKLGAASLPETYVRFFACVDPLVLFQVRSLVIGPIAARIIAVEVSFFLNLEGFDASHIF